MKESFEWFENEKCTSFKETQQYMWALEASHPLIEPYGH